MTATSAQEDDDLDFTGKENRAWHDLQNFSEFKNFDQ